jgi:hypothetical protein
VCGNSYAPSLCKPRVIDVDNMVELCPLKSGVWHPTPQYHVASRIYRSPIPWQTLATGMDVAYVRQSFYTINYLIDLFTNVTDETVLIFFKRSWFLLKYNTTSLKIPKGVIRLRKSSKDRQTQCSKEKVQNDKQRSAKHYTKYERTTNTNPTKNRRRTQMSRKGRQFLLY